MPTFKELQNRVQELTFKISIYEHLVEYIDSKFKAPAGQDPKLILLTNDTGVKVPSQVFDHVAQDILEFIQGMRDELEVVNNTTIEVPNEQASDGGAPTETDQPGNS